MSDFITHLTALTHPDTNAIRNAEAAIKPMLKDPRCVEALLDVLSNFSNDASVRHIAAILLRKRISSHYSKFDAGTQGQFKAKLLSVTGAETERSVRLGLIGVIGAVAKIGESSEWNELYAFILQAAGTADNPEARELAYLLLEELTDTLASSLEAALPNTENQQAVQLLQLMTAGLNDANPKVSAAAVKASGSMLSFVAETPYMEDPRSFASLLTLIIQVADKLKNESEEAVGITLDVLYDLILGHCKSVTDNIEGVLAWTLSILCSSNLENNLRDSAALVIATLAEVHSRKIIKIPNAIPQIINSLYSLLDGSEESAAGALFENNPLWAEELEEELGDSSLNETSLTSMAQGTLDMLCLHLPSKVIYPIIHQNTSQRLNDASMSSKVDFRKSGLACLGVAAEGCSEAYRANLNEILQWVLRGLSDPEVKVREVACFALGQLAEHCQPSILKYSMDILPTLFPLLDDPTTTVQVTSCYVLEQFCERLEPKDVRAYLQPLVEKLVMMLERSQRRSIQEMSVAALSAVAVASEEEFIPYLQGVCERMNTLINIPIQPQTTGPTNTAGHNSLRGRALECFGHIAIAVGKEAFTPYFSDVMSSAALGLSSDDTDLHEFAYVVFANLAKVMENDFSPVLAELVPHLIKVVESNDGALEWAENPNASQAQFIGLDDSDDEGENQNGFLTVRTAMLDAKRAAVTALGEMSRYCGPSFCPYTEQTLTVLTKIVAGDESNAAATYGTAMLHGEIAEALSGMVMPAVKTLGSEVSWVKGSPTTQPALTPQVIQSTDACLRALLHILKEDMEGSVVGKAAESIQNIIQLLGCSVLLPNGNHSMLEELLGALYSILSGNAPCCMYETALEDYQDEDEGGLDDKSDHQSYLVSVCDLIGALCSVLGDNMGQFLPQFLPEICKFGKPSRSSTNRAMTMGLLGEVCEHLTVTSLAQHLEAVFYPAIIAGLGDEDMNVKRNAAYLCGRACESFQSSIASNYMGLLGALSPLFSNQNEDDSDAVVDNAAAAVARMITVNSSAVPLAQVLPVFVAALPLKEDMTENPTVYNCLLKLLEENNSDIIALKGEVMRAFQGVAKQCQEAGDSADMFIQDELKQKIASAIQQLQ